MTEDLDDAHRSVARNAPLRTKTGVLQADQRVRIRGGPLRGSEGTILDCREVDRLLIAMDGLQRGVYLQIDVSLVELV